MSLMVDITSVHVVEDAWVATDLPEGAIVTIGNYDGLHRGQRLILEKVTARAKACGVPSVVVTFEPHPTRFIRPEEAPELLTTESQKRELLAEVGVDVVLFVRFNLEVAETSAEDFVRGFLHRRLALKELYVGNAFTFGAGRKGDLNLLRKLAGELGFMVHGIAEEKHQGELVSSTRIRRALKRGQVELVAELLTRPYEIHGEVVRGDRMGQRLGWPTINVEPVHELVPAEGVYACRVVFAGVPTAFDAVTNIGTRPTVYENYQEVVESHVLAFSNDAYGQKVRLSFYKRLREERIFPSIMDLSSQIKRDVASTREYFASLDRLEGSNDSDPVVQSGFEIS